MCCIGLSHAFGKGAGFACGLIFLNVIFICIIAFNKNIVYVGDGYNSNNNYYNPYGSNGYGSKYALNLSEGKHSSEERISGIVSLVVVAKYDGILPWNIKESAHCRDPHCLVKALCSLYGP